jgi:hypothetical protein
MLNEYNIPVAYTFETIDGEVHHERMLLWCKSENIEATLKRWLKRVYGEGTILCDWYYL